MACADWLEAEIDQIDPRAIVALGSTAARSLLGYSVPVNEHAGQWLQRNDGRPVLVLHHPAAVLRAAPEARAALHARWLRLLGDAARYLPDVRNVLDASNGPDVPDVPDAIDAIDAIDATDSPNASWA